MKFSYKFSNLLGTIYRCGNLCFTSNGNSVISPVGNRISIFDLKENKSKTLSLESQYNYCCIALSPNGSLLLAVNEQGEAHLISIVSCTIIHRHKFQSAVQQICFSPNGEHFAVAKENLVFIFKTPGEITGEYNPFVLERHIFGAYNDITWVDWSTNSCFLAIGSKDNSIKICSIKYVKKFRNYVLGGHTEAIVGCYFEDNSLHLNTISRNGLLCIWECSMDLSQLIESNKTLDTNQIEPQKKKNRKLIASKNNSSSDSDFEFDIEKSNTENIVGADDENDIKDKEVIKTHQFKYKKLCRHFLANEPKKENPNAILTAANYHKKTKILVTAFSTGSFYLYELPDVNMIHSLSISDYSISSVCFNQNGDWISLASSELGQLLVWEWQSEQYIMKQQGHSSEMSCMAYSPDGQYIATGGEDSKVKLWNVNNGFCFVTFHEHTSGVTGIEFSNNKKFLISCSLDGTVRAYDVIRYRNFRTFTSPEPVQFSCMAIDNSGELVAAGGQDVFEIYLWSIKLGKLLEVISSHEGPVCTIAFSPSPISSTLVSGSWDGTIKIWNCLENDSQHETIDVGADVTCVAFRPNGEEIAVATLNGNISFFELKTSTQLTSIEGRNDLGSGVLETDLITAKKNLEGKAFTSIVYSADGECILASGKSQFICIYHVGEGILLKKFEITQNHSFDGLDEYINRRKITEFGNMALIEEREKLEGGKISIRLPGVQKGDMATRNYKPEIKVFSVRFSPTGQQWSAACTEGLLVYSLDKGVVFDPFNLSLEVTPKTTKDCLKNKEYLNAIIMAIKLNEADLIQLVIESIPYKEINLLAASLPNEFTQRVLQNVSKLLQSTPHIEFYLKWSCALLTEHGNKDNMFQHQILLSLHESLQRKYDMFAKICDFNKYTLKVLRNLPQNCINEDDKLLTNDIDEEMVLVKSNILNGELNSDFISSNDESD